MKNVPISKRKAVENRRFSGLKNHRFLKVLKKKDDPRTRGLKQRGTYKKKRTNHQIITIVERNTGKTIFSMEEPTPNKFNTR